MPDKEKSVLSHVCPGTLYRVPRMVKILIALSLDWVTARQRFHCQRFHLTPRPGVLL